MRTRYSIATCRRMRSSLAAVDDSDSLATAAAAGIGACGPDLEERKTAGDGASHRIDGLSRFADVGKGFGLDMLAASAIH